MHAILVTVIDVGSPFPFHASTVMGVWPQMRAILVTFAAFAMAHVLFVPDVCNLRDIREACLYSGMWLLSGCVV